MKSGLLNINDDKKIRFKPDKKQSQLCLNYTINQIQPKTNQI